ncbi:putative alkylhalidase [Arcticibacter svalbardensis MN12-7]|uniref:Putative alkylhalidase n=1 Tax=Arcticibacter svalbardensis MN12-7 TaxID=1150600 RepID=R9GSU0_9SPHI|nr:NAD(P)/FAD-dependent oxidoreductase [Arcticibacter svalbardensis]EOR94776.1 putative alkylhalidase [Arcticibacter svalbardensis MN12-7]
MCDVIIAGGGLAGLFNALLLNKAGLQVTVIEKKSYPFHRVCGEYISNEVLPFFKELDIDVTTLHASNITRLEVTATSGAKFAQQLDLGGFGLSRYTFDQYLYHKCKAMGVTFMLDTRVENIQFIQNSFEVTLPDRILTAPLVIGSFGKRSNLDSKLNRSFFHHRSPYIGIKIHAKIDFPDNLIQLNSFKNGYCGVSKIEDDRYCICSLAHRDDLRQYGNLQDLQEGLINKNPYQKALFKNAEMLMDKPEVINEISFEKKQPVEQHILMSGDTAGMIAPLCGNGMTMAIHSAKILSEIIIRSYKDGSAFSLERRNKMEQSYIEAWNKQFAKRLWTGRKLQSMFGNNTLMNLAIHLMNGSPAMAAYLIKRTHGKPFGLLK